MINSKKFARYVSAVIVACVAHSSAFAQKAPTDAEEGRANPEAASGFQAKKLVRAKKHMIVAANPYASRAGLEILRKGGSAIDAAIAAQLVLNLVEPQSSGIGGGAFILHWDKSKSELKTYDGREKAPNAAKPDRFLLPGGVPQPFFTAVGSPQSVGVPGLLRVLEKAHAAHGKLSWKELFQPAINLSETGFKVSPRLNKLLSGLWTRKFSPEAKAYFFNERGKPWPVGHILKNPKFARTLRLVAERGADIFHNGMIGIDIVGTLQLGIRSSDITLNDVRSYQAEERPPSCTTYRGYKICGMGPPSSGGHTVGQTLKLLDGFKLGDNPMNANALHLIAEAEKLAYADRNRYSADPDYVEVPKGMLDPQYLKKRALLINPNRAVKKAAPGRPPHVKEGHFGRDATIESNGTTHISIIDSDGNAISMTSTIESAFGSGHMSHGFLLNNELTDFSFRPKDKKGRPIANRVEGGKRPRSSMAPTFVFDPEGNLRMITGSPGGTRIILFVVKSIIAHIDWNANAYEAAAWPNFGSRNGPFEIEPDALPENTVTALKSRGHSIRTGRMTSGTHVIILRDNEIEGGADPRREGQALGD